MLACRVYYLAMPTKKYQWTTVDNATAVVISDLMSRTGKTDRGLAEDLDIDISYNRVRDLRLGLKAPARLSEFISICKACKVDPSEKINEILESSMHPGISKRLVAQPEPSATVDPSVSDSSAPNASSAPTSADSGSSQSASNTPSSSDASSVSPSAADDDYISHIADLIAADPSQFALMAHTDPNKFLESTTPHD